MILFKKLRYKNFLSTGNIFTQIELDKHTTTLVVGDNGSGKSTMLDALTFVLFGKPFRKINKPQLLNTITRKDMVVEIEFSIGTTQYKIIRGIKPNIFEVYQNGSLLNQSADVKDYQEILEKQIIKVNYKSFCQVVVLGSATFQPFMQLTTAQRREVIEDLLDLQIFTVMNSLLKNKVLTNTQELDKIESNKKSIQDKIALVKAHLKEIQSSNDSLIEEKKQRISETEIKIKELKEETEKISFSILELSSKVSDEDALRSKLNELLKLRNKIETNLENLKNEVSFFEKYDNCPTCKQPIEEKFKSKEIETKNEKINEINEGLAKLYSQYSKLEKKIKDIMTTNSKINDLRIEENLHKVKISTLLNYITDLQSETNKLKTATNTNNENKIIEYENELSTIETKHKHLLEDKSVLASAAVLLKDGGIKAKIIKQYIPIINKLINKYLASLDFFIQFELNEEFKETIKSRYRDDFSYDSFSEGEKMKINLAILFAWRAVAKLRNSINTNLLIMDEVFDSSLDSNGTEEFMKLLNSLTADTNTFIISHKKDQLIEKFQNVIKFEKKKNFSKVA